MIRRLFGLLVAVLIVGGCAEGFMTPSPAGLTSSPTTLPSATAERAATATPSATPTIVTPTPSLSPAPVAFGQISRRHIVGFTAVGLRVEGTAGEQRGAAYISAALTAAGLAPELRPFTAADDNGKTVHSNNVVAVKVGLSPREIVVGAHYDSTSGGTGADDNASGVAMMLEMAELLSGRATPYTIRFVAFGAEEGGMLGSSAFVAAMGKTERANTVGFVNLDSVIAGDFEYVYGDERLPSLRDWALTFASNQGLGLKTIRNVDLTDGEGYGSADYDAFQKAGIPFVYFEATDWTLGDKDGYTQVAAKYGKNGELRHTKFDTLAYIDANFPGMVDTHLSMVSTILYHLLTEYR